MTYASQFAYTQARLQARHGMRPAEQTWHRLAATGDLASYLQIARHTPIKDWVTSIHPASTNHEIETRLRQLFTDYVDEVARWQPVLWQSAFSWCKNLPLLPALRHLLAGEPVPDWLRHDTQLKLYTSENQELRIQALQTSKFSPIVEAWGKNVEPVNAWLMHWKHLWPKTTQQQKQSLEHLTRIFTQYLESLSSNQRYQAKSVVDIHTSLKMSFRYFAFQPAAAFAHIGLIALDIQQLRADLLVRCLFSNIKSETTS